MRRMVLLAALLLAAPACAEERITDYGVTLRVAPDAGVEVIEEIAVLAENQRIRHGIYRDIPTDYVDRIGRRSEIGLSLVETSLDGQPVPNSTKRLGNGERIYLGDPNAYVSPGPHRYRIRYRVRRVIGYFDAFDELYWNATGNGWDFPIDAAHVTLHLPPGGAPTAASAYTGPMGAQGRDWRMLRPDAGTVRVETTKPLGVHEGLTAAVAWPKGFVTQPGPAARFGQFLLSNLGLLVAILSVAALIWVYLRQWWRHGRDAKPGTIIPLFAPPEGVTPALAATIRAMGVNRKARAAVLVSLAVSGHLTIERRDASFWLKRTGKTEPPEAEEEAVLLSALFGVPESVRMRQDLVHLSKTYDPLVAQSFERFERVVKNRAEGVYYETNAPRLLWPLAASFGLFGLNMLLINPKGSIAVMVASMILAPCLLYLLKAPTAAGRAAMDHLEGFRLYLSTAERLRYEALAPPHLTPELFERYFPYAIALGVENRWAQIFQGSLSPEEQMVSSYRPHWYLHDGMGMGSLGAMSDALGGGLGGSIASASSAPGSSSGGGGGGGGGGGW